MTTRSRQERLVQKLQEIARDLSGYPSEELKPEVSFLELGFDSLFLTQLSTAYKKEFGIQITFRQLFDEYPSMVALATLIDSVLPGDRFAESPVTLVELSAKPKAEEAPVSAPPMIVREAVGSSAPPMVEVKSGQALQRSNGSAAWKGDGLAAVLLQQLDLMAEQLRVLEAGSQVGFVRAASSEDNGRALPAVPAVETSHDDGKPPQVPLPESVKLPQSVGFGPAAIGGSGQQPLPQVQQRHLDSLIERYTRKTKQSKERTQRYRRALADPRTAAGFNRRWKEIVYPIWVERSLGSKLWDVDGNEYIDLLNGFGPNFFGHSPRFVTEAIERQLGQGFEVGPQTPLIGEVAEMICQLTGMDRVSFCCSGSEAVQAAMRLSRTVTGRDKVVLFTRDYHGNFDQVLVREANQKGKLRTMPSAPGIPFQSVDDTYVLEYGADESLDIIKEHSEEIAAVLLEPIQTRRPEFQPRQFLHRLREITRDRGIVLVFDEVVTGFRVAPGGAQAYYGIEADLATYGKVVAGGMPIGIVAGREAVMNTFDGGFWQYGDDSFPCSGVTFFAGTFVRHPLVIAAAHASLKHMIVEGPALQQRVADKASRLSSKVNGIFNSYSANIELAQFSSIMYLRNHEQSELAGLLHYHLRYNGVHIQEGFPCYTTDAHTEDDIDRVLHAFEQSVASMAKAGIVGSGGSKSVGLRGEAKDSAERRSVVVARAEDGGLVPKALPAKFPSTALQREMWLAAQMNPAASCANNGSNVVHLVGELDTSLLKEAIRAVARQHEALRCTFSEDGTEVVVSKDKVPEIHWHDLSELASEVQVREVDRIIEEDGRQLFNLGTGPVASFRIIKLSDESHLLVFTAQMIVCDGWGFKVVIEELSRIYSALVDKRSLGMDTARQMREYVEWQSGEEARALERKSEMFWLSKLDPAPSVFDLKTARVRPPNRTYEARREDLRLEGSFYQEVKRASRQLKNTPFATLLTSFAIWLHRLGGSRDVVISVPFAAQGPLELSSHVGQAVHTLPIRFSLDSSETFRTTLNRSRNLILDAQEHWNTNLGSIVRMLELPSDPSRLPVTSVMFNMDPAMGGVDFTGCHSRVSSGPRLFYTYDIGFNVVDEGESLLIECDYNSNLYDSDSVACWLRGFRALLEAALADPNRLLCELPMLEEREQARLLAGLDGPPQLVEAGLTVDALVSARAEDCPQAAAIDFGSLRLTYRELEERARRLADRLALQGLRQGNVVAVCIEKSAEFCIAAFAVLKAGFAFVAADPNWDEDRMRFVLRDSAAALILSRSTEFNSRLSGTGLPSLAIHAEPEENARHVRRDGPSDRDRSGDLACIVYPPGSRSASKGMAITHAALTANLLAIKASSVVSQDDAVASVNPWTSIVGVLEIFLSLTTGARLVVDESAQGEGAPDLSEFVARHGITAILALPAVWRHLVRAKGLDARRVKLICVGDVPPQCLHPKLRESFGQVWNLYCRDNTVAALLLCCPERGAARGRLYPLAGVTARIVDSRGQIVPPGVMGNLMVGGTASIGADCRSSRDHCRILTGDLARYWADGSIEVIGSSDRQIILNHGAFHSTDVERILLQSSPVQDAAVVLLEAGASGKRLVGYVACQGSSEANKPQLRQQLRDVIARSLPSYSRPSAIVVVDEIPRTTSGDIDYNCLPLPTAGDEDTGAVALGTPRNSVEAKIAQFWAEVLNLESPSVTANFFEIGGQSFQAVSLFAKLEKEFGKKLPLALLLKHPTIEELARVVAEGNDQSLWSTLVSIQASGSRPPLFLVHGAGGNVLLFRALADRLSPDYPVYGLQSKGLDGRSRLLHTIEEMAREYLREVRSIQPKGPYYLGGYCLGGTIAYEMAQVLLQERESVALLAMLDTYNYSRALRVGFGSFLLQKVRFHLANMSELGPRELFKYLKEKTRLALGGELANLRTSVPGGALEEVGRATSGVELSIQTINDRAAEEYEPRPYAGDVTIIKPRLNYKFYPDPKMGYGDLIRGRLELVEVGAHPHAMLIEPHVELLAVELKRKIDSSSEADSQCLAGTSRASFAAAR